MAERQDKQPSPSKRGFKSISTSVREDQHQAWFVFCKDRDISSGELLRRFIQATLKATDIEHKDPVNITIQSFEGLNGRTTWEDDGHVQANMIFAEVEIKRVGNILDEKGWVALAMKQHLAKICRGLTLTSELGERLRTILDAPDKPPNVISRNRDTIGIRQ